MTNSSTCARALAFGLRSWLIGNHVVGRRCPSVTTTRPLTIKPFTVPTSLNITSVSLGSQICRPPSTSIYGRSIVLLLPTVRSKKSKAGGERRTLKPEDEEDDDDDDGFHRTDQTDDDMGGKEVTVHVPSLRLDTILKAGFVTSRLKMDTVFYESRVRMNGARVLKKSATVGVGDDVDLIIGPNEKSDRYLDVSRIRVTAVRMPKVADGRTNMSVKLRRYKVLTIENYADRWTTAGHTDSS